MAIRRVAPSQLFNALEAVTVQFMRNFAEEAGHRTVDKTPVADENGGQLRGSIALFENSPDTNDSRIRDPVGSSTKASISAKANTISGKKDLFVTAGADYAGEVELGDADNPPSGFLRRTVNEAQDIANVSARRVQ